MRTLTNVLASVLALARGGVHACPNCNGVTTRRNTASPARGAWLCDDCGCRWRP